MSRKCKWENTYDSKARCQVLFTTGFPKEDGKPYVNWWRTCNTQKGNHLVMGVGEIRDVPQSLFWRIRTCSAFAASPTITEGFKSNIPQHLHDYAGWRISYANFARNICVTYMYRRIHAGCARHISANPTQMLRAPAARGARNKRWYFWQGRIQDLGKEGAPGASHQKFTVNLQDFWQIRGACAPPPLDPPMFEPVCNVPITRLIHNDFTW
jgi:hypothetical protein